MPEDLESTYPELTRTLTYLETNKRGELVKEVDESTGQTVRKINEAGAQRISAFATQARKDNRARNLDIRSADNKPRVNETVLNDSNRDWVALLQGNFNANAAISGLCGRIRANILAAPTERPWAHGTTIWTDICPEAIETAGTTVETVQAELLALIKSSLPENIAKTVKSVKIDKLVSGHGHIVVEMDIKQAE